MFVFAKKTHQLNRLKSKNIDFEFTPECKKEFEQIKKLLSTYPVIAHPNNNKPFILHTDASNQGIGGTLSQIGEDGLEHPVSFVSRSLNPCERNYSTTEKELLAAQWCMHKYKHFLFGQKFNLFTDHQPLRGIFANKSNDVSSRIVRLLSKTTDYHPNIIYKKGKDNVVADALSRAIYATSNSTNLDAPPMVDRLAHIDLETYNRLNEPDSDPPEEPSIPLPPITGDSSNVIHRENPPQAPAEDITQLDINTSTENPRKYEITRNAYLWISNEKSKHLLDDFRRNKSPYKYFIVSQYIDNDELQQITALTSRIYTLDKLVLKNPLPILVEESLNQGDYKIDFLHLQTHLDIERLIDSASR